MHIKGPGIYFIDAGIYTRPAIIEYIQTLLNAVGGVWAPHFYTKKWGIW